MTDWLRRVRHDLVKRAVWEARDLRDLGRAPRPSDLWALRAGLYKLHDEEGRPIDARALWKRLSAGAPAAARPALPAVAQAIEAAFAAVSSAEADSSKLPAVLDALFGIEEAVEALARSMNLQN